jgi:heterodisulfide reductase subunit B
MAAMVGGDGKFSDCIGCGQCSRVCEHTAPKYVMMYMKSFTKGVTVPKIYDDTGFVVPISDVSRDECIPEWSEGNLCLMSGCIVEAKAPYLVYSAVSSLKSMGFGCTKIPENKCCTYPVPFRQMTDGERDALKVKISDSAEGKRILALCPGCEDELVNSGADASHIVRFYAEHSEEIRRLGGVKMKVALEPGCHGPELMDDMLKVVEATGAEYIGNPMGCCGKTVPEISDKLMAERQMETEGADVIISACPMCFSRYDEAENGKPVLFITELVALAAGDRITFKYHNIVCPM